MSVNYNKDILLIKSTLLQKNIFNFGHYQTVRLKHLRKNNIYKVNSTKQSLTQSVHKLFLRHDFKKGFSLESNADRGKLCDSLIFTLRNSLQSGLIW